MVHLAKDTSTVAIQTEENEAKYLGACSHECASKENNRYVKAHNISDEEKEKRLENFKELV